MATGIITVPARIADQHRKVCLGNATPVPTITVAIFVPGGVYTIQQVSKHCRGKKYNNSLVE